MANELIIKIAAEADAFNDELEKVAKKTKNLEDQLRKLSKISGIAFAGLTATIGASTKAFADFETALVGVQKTTNISDKDIKGFSDEITKLSRTIPVSTNELLSLAQTAGQLGVTGTDNLLKFAETIAKVGVSTDLAGEEAATAFTRILNVTGEGIENIDKFASVIVRLGNNSAATESQITRVANEVARSTTQFKLSSANVAALSAALQSVGVRAELGGSAVGRAFRAIDKSIREGKGQFKALQEITGLTGDQLKKTFKEDATSVFQSFIEGLGAIQAQEGDTTSALAAFGLKGEEILKVLPVIAARSEILGEKLKLASDEMENTTALNKEAAKAFDTLSSQFNILINNVTNLARQIGTQFAPQISTAIGLLSDFFEFISKNPELVKFSAAAIAVGAALTGLVTALALGGIALIKFRAGLAASSLAFPGVAKGAKSLGTILTKQISTWALLRKTAKGTSRAIKTGFSSSLFGIPKLAGKAGKSVSKLGRVVTGLKFSIRGLVSATGIGLLFIALEDLVTNFDKRTKQIGSIIVNFANQTGKIFSSFGGILKGAFTFDTDAIKKNYAELTKATSEATEQIAKDFLLIDKEELLGEEAFNVSGFSEGIAKEGEKAVDAQRTINENLLSEQEKQKGDSEAVQAAKIRAQLAQEQGLSEEIITLRNEEADLIKQIEEEKSETLKGLLQNRLDENREAQGRAFEDEMERRRVFFEEIVAQNEEFQALTKEQQEAFFQENRELIMSEDQLRKQVQNEALRDRLKKKQKADKEFLKNEEKFGKTQAKLRQFLESEEVKGAQETTRNLVQLQRSKNSTLRGIGKVAAITEILIRTATGAMNALNAFNFIPIVGPALGFAAAAAVTAFGAEQIGQVKGAQDGGIATGGVPGRDSIPFMLSPGELVAPDRNFDEVVNAVADSRRAEEGETSGPQEMGVTVGFTDNAFEIIEQKLLERRAIGVGQI